MLGAYPLGSVPLMYVSTDYSVLPRFTTLLENQEMERSYLLIASPYDVNASAVRNVFFSTGIETPILNVDGTMVAFPARLMTAINYQSEIFGDGVLESGASSQSFGAISIHIGDGQSDALTGYAWDGRPFSILMGQKDFAYDEYRTVLSGVCRDASWNESVLTIVADDPAVALSEPVVADQYTGDGYVAGVYTGDAGLVNVAKPFCLGSVLNIDPVLVDAANQVYQFNAAVAGDDLTATVTNAYDSGVPLTRVTLSSPSDVYAWTPVAGRFAWCTAGIMRLGAQPTGPVTADVVATYAPGGIGATGVANYIKYLVTHRLNAAITIDADSFARVGTLNNATVGLWVRDPSTESVDSLIDQLLTSIGGYRSFNRDGSMSIGVFDFSDPVLTLDAEHAKILSITRETTPPPHHTRKLGYQRCWRVQTESEIDGGATAAQREFISRPMAYAQWSGTGAATLTRRKLARQSTQDTLLRGAASAAAEVERQKPLLQADRDIYTIDAKRIQFLTTVGCTVRLHYPRFNLDRDFIVIGLTENTDSQITTLKLWG